MDFEYVDEDETYAGQREYHSSLDAALHSWGNLNDRPAVVKEVNDVVKRIAEVNGAVTKAFIPARARSYVAVMFERDSKRAGAWVHVGFVDHLIPLENSEHYAEKRFYRSKLSTWTEKNRGKWDESTKGILCPRCPGMVVPVTGSCGCGWNAASIAKT